MRGKLRIIVFCEIQFFSNENSNFIYLFIYLFVYSFIYLFIHSFIHSFIYLFIYLFIYSFIYTFRLFSRNLIRVKFSLLPENVNAIKRRICNTSHKFMIKVERFSASKKSGAIMYK